MKKIFFLTLIIGFVIAGCNKDLPGPLNEMDRMNDLKNWNGSEFLDLTIDPVTEGGISMEEIEIMLSEETIIDFGELSEHTYMSVEFLNSEEEYYWLNGWVEAGEIYIVLPDEEVKLAKCDNRTKPKKPD